MLSVQYGFCPLIFSSAVEAGPSASKAILILDTMICDKK